MVASKNQKILLVHPEPCIRNLLRHLVHNILKDEAVYSDIEYASSLLEVKKGLYDLIVAHLTDVSPSSEDIHALRELRKGPDAWLGAFIGLAFSTSGAHRVFTKEERHPVIQYFFHIDRLKEVIHERKGISRTEQCIFWRRVFCEPEYVKSQASLLIHEATKMKWPSVELCIENLENCVGKQRPDLVKRAHEYCKKKITDKLLWENLLQPLLDGTYE